MQDELLALLLLMGGMGCISAWVICNVLAALRGQRIQREADAIKMHLVKGGSMPSGAPLDLARHYLHVRWLGILGNVMLTAGIVVMVLAHFVIF